MKKEDFIKEYINYNLRTITIIAHQDNEERFQFKCTKGTVRKEKLDINKYLILDGKHLVDKIVSDYLKENTNIQRKLIHKDKNNRYESTQYKSFEGSILRLIMSSENINYKHIDERKDYERDALKKYRDLIQDGSINNIIIKSADHTKFEINRFATNKVEKENDMNNNLIINIKEKNNNIDHIAIEKTKELLNCYLNSNKERITNVLFIADKYNNEQIAITFEDNCMILINDKIISKEFESSIDKSKRYVRVRKEK